MRTVAERRATALRGAAKKWRPQAGVDRLKPVPLALPETAHLVQGPVDKNGSAVDVLPVDKPPGAAVARGHAVVAQDKIAFSRHLLGSPRDAVPVLLRDVILQQRAA